MKQQKTKRVWWPSQIVYRTGWIEALHRRLRICLSRKKERATKMGLSLWNLFKVRATVMLSCPRNCRRTWTSLTLPGPISGWIANGERRHDLEPTKVLVQIRPGRHEPPRGISEWWRRRSSIAGSDYWIAARGAISKGPRHGLQCDYSGVWIDTGWSVEFTVWLINFLLGFLRLGITTNWIVSPVGILLDTPRK